MSSYSNNNPQQHRYDSTHPNQAIRQGVAPDFGRRHESLPRDPRHAQDFSSSRVDASGMRRNEIEGRRRPLPAVPSYGQSLAQMDEHLRVREEARQRALRPVTRAVYPATSINLFDQSSHLLNNALPFLSSDLSTRNRNTYQSSLRPELPSLSMFNAPTATRMWPTMPLSSEGYLLTATYRDHDRSGSESSKESTRASRSPVLDEQHYSRPYTELPSAPINIPAPDTNSILEPLQRISISGPSHSPYVSSSQPNRGLFHLDAHPRPSLPSMGGSSVAQHKIEEPYGSLPAPVSLAPNIQRVPPAVEPTIMVASSAAAEKEWEEYAHAVKTPEGLKWQCHWRATDYNGTQMECIYRSKRQLVKRHVETTHLKYKPFVCGVCGKTFPQKTSLDTHMHGHTGEKPHVCRYGCGKTFKDPARRHRHMVEEHGYVPRQFSRHQKPGSSEVAGHESVAPWQVDG